MQKEERNRRWRAVFTAKGIHANYTHKAKASKRFDTKTKAFKYRILFGVHNMFGAEVFSFELPAKSTAKPDTRFIEHGLTA